LEYAPERRAVGVAPVHQPRDVIEAHVTCEQLLVIEHPDAALPHDAVPVEGEVDFLDAVTLRARAELRLRARRAATEQDGVSRIHPNIVCHLLPWIVCPLAEWVRRSGFAPHSGPAGVDDLSQRCLDA